MSAPCLSHRASPFWPIAGVATRSIVSTGGPGVLNSRSGASDLCLARDFPTKAPVACEVSDPSPGMGRESPGTLRDRARRSLAAPVRERARRDHRNRTAAGPSLFLPAAQSSRAVTSRPSGSADGRLFFPRARSSRQAIGGRASAVPAYPFQPVVRR